MKYANTARGYDMAKINEEIKWFQHPSFPLVPQFGYRIGDEWNANNWSFCWLWFRLWSLEHFSFEFAIELESTGLNIKCILGWLRIVVRVVPLPDGWDSRFRRKPAGVRNNK